MRRADARRAATLAAVMVMVTAGVAGAANGQPLTLGQPNTATLQTALDADLSGAASLRIDNQGGNSALSLFTNAGVPPFRVNRTAKVANLNADLLDGNDSSAFLPAAGTAVNADQLDGIDSTGFLKGQGSATSKAFTVAAGAEASRYVGWTAVGYVEVRKLARRFTRERS